MHTKKGQGTRSTCLALAPHVDHRAPIAQQLLELAARASSELARADRAVASPVCVAAAPHGGANQAREHADAIKLKAGRSKRVVATTILPSFSIIQIPETKKFIGSYA